MTWRRGAGVIADQTMCLSPAAAAFVDRHVAAVAHKIGPAQLVRLIEEAKARFDPETTEAERQAAADRRRFDLDLDERRGRRAPCGSRASSTWPTPWTWRPRSPPTPTNGCPWAPTESLDVRRSIAAGNLARNQHGPRVRRPTAPQHPRRGRQVVLHVHLSEGAVLGAGGLARLQEARAR